MIKFTSIFFSFLLSDLINKKWRNITIISSGLAVDRSDYFEYPSCTTVRISLLSWIKISLRIFETLTFKFTRYTLDLVSSSIQRVPKALFRPGMSDKNEHLSTSGLESTGGSAQVCTVSWQINGSKMARNVLFRDRVKVEGKKRERA